MKPAAARTALALVLAAACIVPSASADSGQLTASQALYEGGSTQEGLLSAFFIAEGESGPQGVAIPFLDIRATRMEALTIERRWMVGPSVPGVPTQPIPDPTYDANAPPLRSVLDDVQAVLTAHQQGFQLHALREQHPLAFESGSAAGDFVPFSSVYIAGGEFKPEPTAPTDYQDQTPASGDFWGVVLDSPHVVQSEKSGLFDITFQGDMVLEMQGITMVAEDADDKVTLASGRWNEAAVGLPGLARQRDILVRMFLEDATVHLSTQGGLPRAHWASPSLSTLHTGPVTLEGATGTVENDDGVKEFLQGQRYVLGGATTLQLAPGGETLSMGVQPTPATAVGPTPGLDGKAPFALVGVGAVLALLAAIAIGLVRRVTTRPDLRAVELAIEGGRYARAARLAKRILRHTPGLEDAVLGRAIALSRDGRAGEAIAVVRAQLETRGATDGSLHYVLGLAYLDLGRDEDARGALAEAVRLTPALEAEVSARLGGSTRSASTGGDALPAPPSLREVHGYA